VSAEPDFDAKLLKLPLWARQYIEKVAGDLADAKEKLAAGPDNSNTFVTNYGASPDRPLGTDPTIQFRLADGAIITARIDGNSVMVRSDGGRSMAIRPKVSNAVSIVPMDH
jgi:hypothetical protein